MKSFIFSMPILIMSVSTAMATSVPSVEYNVTETTESVSGVTMTTDTITDKNNENNETTVNPSTDNSALTNYERRVYRYRRLWNFLIPTQTVIQYAGNMGVVSVGMGWDYGNHRQYETNLLFGYLPRFNSSRAKMTMTFKQNFVPWRLPAGSKFNVEPLTCGIYFNTVFGHEFWGREPKRYPDKYYEFLSTKVRINVFAGQRFTAIVPHNRRKFMKSLTIFYEISTCDIYLRAMLQDNKISLWDIVGLSIGLKLQTM